MAADKPAAGAAACTVAAMLAFAGNSLLCRFALREDAIDPGSFTAPRLASGALAVLLIVCLRGRKPGLRRHGNPSLVRGVAAPAVNPGGPGAALGASDRRRGRCPAVARTVEHAAGAGGRADTRRHTAGTARP